MASKISNGVEIVDASSGDIVTLTSRGGFLRGEVLIRNIDNQQILIRNGEVRCDAFDKLAMASEGKAFPVTIASRVAANSETVTRMSIRVDPRVPAGDYSGELSVGSTMQPIRMVVNETVRVKISPEQWVICDRAGAVASKRISIHNDGNVEIIVRDSYCIRLLEEVVHSRDSGVAQEQDPTKDALIPISPAFISRRSIASLQNAGTVVVSNQTGKRALMPDEKHNFDFEVKLPETLEAESRFIASVPFYTGNLVIIMLPFF